MADSITKEIMAITAKYCQKELDDFKRVGIHLYKKTDDIYQCINFQASQWNSAENGEFTINLVVTSPVLYTYWTGGPFPKNPASATWPICVRIGLLLPNKRDLWWKVNQETSTNKIAMEILDYIKTVGLPFLNSYQSIDDIGNNMLPDSELPNLLLKALICKLKDNESESLTFLQSALSQSKGKPFEETVKIITERLGFTNKI
jgi:hypothetical protein